MITVLVIMNTKYTQKKNIFNIWGEKNTHFKETNATVYPQLPPLQTHHPPIERHWQKAGCKPQSTDNEKKSLSEFSQYSRGKCYETKVKRAGGERMLPISTLGTHNSHPPPYVLVCSLPKYVARHGGGTANVCKLPWKHIVIFLNTAFVQHWLKFIISLIQSTNMQ